MTVYEDGIRVTYRLLSSVPTEVDTQGRVIATRVDTSEPQTLDLPGWCAGEPRLCVALYLFGTRDGLGSVLLDGWDVL